MNIVHSILRLALGQRLPVTAGEIRLSGPVAPVTIRRDRYGVPHIDAASEVDAMFALGFCQSQDRGGQLEFLLRIARGQLAEWVGPPALTLDRVSRRIGFHRAALMQIPALDDHARLQLNAFAAGVTAGATAGTTSPAHEFAILGGKPTPWEIADIVAILKLQTFLLPSNWDVELARLRILLADGPEAVTALDPICGEVIGIDIRRDGIPSGSRTAAQAVVEALQADLAALQRYLPRGGGSNNWVIAGSRTASRQPLLASDPHLAPTAPPPWYLAHMKTPDWSAAGAGFVGTPGFAIGHNGFAAWGVTAGLTDNTDLFVETLGPDGRSVREADGTWTACDAVRETIRVRGQPDVVEEVLLTPRGPLISPLLADISHGISLRAVWLDPLPIDGFLSVYRTRSFEAFWSCFAKWPVLPQNIVYADASGTTGWFLVGQLPKRAGGHGLVPRPAEEPGTGWTGLVPYDKMPFVVDPSCGFWATANTDPTPADRADVWLGADYCDPYRRQAILDALAARDIWTAEDCMALQLDLRSIPWEELRAVVLSLEPTTSDARDGLKLLGQWDGRVEADSAAACVFELFVAEMCVRVARAKAPRAWAVALGESALWEEHHNLFCDRRVKHLVGLLQKQPDGWFPSWQDEMLDALAGVVRKLRVTVGPGPAYWAWGHMRQLRLEHPLFGRNRWLGGVFNLGPVPCGGDCNTVSQAGARPANPTDFTHNMANLRTVFDLADLGHSRFVLCGGQSGNPWSPHFADQFPLWQAGEAITIPWDQATVIRESKETLRLLPG